VFTALRARPEEDAASGWQYDRHAPQGNEAKCPGAAHDKHERSGWVTSDRHAFHHSEVSLWSIDAIPSRFLQEPIETRVGRFGIGERGFGFV
jgi:hypothetical protein